MEEISRRALAEEAVRLFRLCFLAARSVGNCNNMFPRANSLHFHVLFILQNEPPPGPTMSQLAEALMSSRQHLSRLIGGMEEKGLVAREHDPVNRRQVYVRVLPAGREMMEGMIEELQKRIAHELGVLDDGERRELFDSLLLFRKMLHKVAAIHYNSPIGEEA